MRLQITSIILIISSLSSLSFGQDNHIFSIKSSMPQLTKEVKHKIQEVPFYKPAKKTKTIKNTSYIDNSKLKFFPRIFNQKGNSCSQASGIRYIFSYEINRLRDVDGSLNQNEYSYHYTWNFLNNGEDMGSWYFDGYNLVKDNGVPSLNEFNDDSGINEKTWMTGYNNYYQAIHNRISDYSKIDASSKDGLDLIKQYLINHGDGSKTGGLLNFSGKSSNWEMIQYSGKSNTGYHYAIRNFGNGGDHAMTIVGFDDSVRIDVNYDGIIQDDEIGALIIVNSWGSNWGSNGRAYMPYKLLYKSDLNGGMGNGDHYVYVMNAEDYEPSVVAKINLKYTSRNDLWMIIGVAESADAESPQKTKTMKIIRKQGGDYYMQGSDTESGKEIEIGLDYSDLIDKIPNAQKFFLIVKQSPEGDLGEGLIKQFVIMDYRNGTTPEEYISDQKKIEVQSSSKLSVAIKTATGLANPDHSGSIKLFPNPVKKGSMLKIENNPKNKITNIEIVDLSGRTIPCNYSQNESDYDVRIPDHLIQGVYILKVSETQNFINRKIIIY